MIPRDFLDDLLIRTDIVSVIGSHIELKKKGTNYTALCPFHNEKTPSFTVNPSKQFYHCFGCGASGDTVSFLMQYCGLTFPQVLNDLAKQHGLSIPSLSQNDSETLKKKITLENKQKNILVKAARFYQTNLKGNQKAISYLKSRGISGKTALRFHLGVAPKGWNMLRDVFYEDYESKFLVDCGLVIKSETKSSGNYDRFRDRLIFPIFNVSGEVVGFGARSFGNENPKYLNSPETEIFSKGKELFGLFEAKHHINKSNQVIVVEGYMDVISLYESGVKNAVASLGTSFTKTQFLLLRKIAETVIFMFDGDTAGKNAAHKALTVILPQLISTVNIQFVFLPEGKDPDSFIQSFGLKSFNKLIHQATPMSEFIFNLSSHGCNQNIAEGRAKLIKNLLSFFKIMSEGILKNQIILEASNRFGFFNNELNLKRYNSNHVFKKNNQSAKKNISSKKIVSLDIRIFKTLTRYPALLNELELLIKEIDESEPEIFSDIQKNAIIFVRENSDFNQNPDKNLFLLKEIIPKSDNLNEEIRSLLEKSCEVDLAIDDISKYDIDSAKLDLKFMLKRLVINHLEMEASRIINTGESFDKLLEVRNKISELTLNKTV